MSALRKDFQVKHFEFSYIKQEEAHSKTQEVFKVFVKLLKFRINQLQDQNCQVKLPQQ